MKKSKIISLLILSLIMFVGYSFLLNPVTLAVTEEEAGGFNNNLDITHIITINGRAFTIDPRQIPHNQPQLNYVNIPFKLGEFNAPVRLRLEVPQTTLLDQVHWIIDSCSANWPAGSQYFIEKDETGNYITRTRAPNPSFTDGGNEPYWQPDYPNIPRVSKVYYESDDPFQDFNVDLALNEPGCYQISMEGHKRNVGSKNEVNNYFVINAPQGSLTPNFRMEFEHSDISIFDESRNETPTVLAPEMATFADTTEPMGTVTVASREWSIQWGDPQFMIGNAGLTLLPLSTSNRQSELFSYNLNNPGQYIITLKVRGTNGLQYEISKYLGVQKSKGYFGWVLHQRDLEHKDFETFRQKVEMIPSGNLRNLYDVALGTGCTNAVVNTPLTCNEETLRLFNEYDSTLEYLNIPCSHFPDLSALPSHNELCRAAALAKKTEAFQGDGTGSSTAGYLRPDASINRIEICAVLNRSTIRAGGFRVVPRMAASESRFDDLDGFANDDWRKRHAEICTEFSGYPDGTFRPANNIQLDETLKVLFGIFNVTVAPSVSTQLHDYCPSLPTDAWYARYLALAFQKGFMEGISENCNPAHFVSRGDVIRLMYRMFYEYLDIPAP